MKPLKYAGLAAGLALLLALSLLPASAQTNEQPVQYQGQAVLTITNEGITGAPDTTQGGLYLVTVRNETQMSRGIVMQGVDLCCSPYTRFTKVLRPGQEVSFRWYFPSNRTVQVKDLIRCVPVARSCGAPLAGSMTRTLVFG